MATINLILRFTIILTIAVGISTGVPKSTFSIGFGNACPEAPHATLSFLENFLESSYNEYAKDAFEVELSELSNPVLLTNSNPVHKSYCDQIINQYPYISSRGDTNVFKAGQYFIVVTYLIWEIDIPDAHSYAIRIYDEQLESLGLYMFMSDL